MINHAYVEMSLSWLCNVEQFGSHEYVMFITTDAAASSQLRAARAAHKWSFEIVEFDQRLDNRLENKLTFGEADYWYWLEYRVQAMTQILDKGVL